MQLCHWTSWICFACHQLYEMKIFFLYFINYTIKVSGPAWFSKMCGFQISNVPVQEGNCFQAALFKESCFHFIFYLRLLCHLGPIHENSNYLIDSNQWHFFSLVFSSDRHKLKIIFIKKLGTYLVVEAVYTRATKISLWSKEKKECLWNEEFYRVTWRRPQP